MTSLVWFRNDLRVSDNPALNDAASSGLVVPVYILDETQVEGEMPELGGASQWWLHHSLDKLEKALGGLLLMKGKPETLIPRLAKKLEVNKVVWNRCYEPGHIKRDKKIKKAILDAGIEAKSFNANLLFEPWEIETQSGDPYKVYSPFWRALQKQPTPKPQKKRSFRISQQDLKKAGGVSLQSLNLRPTKPNWAKGWDKIWTPGEDGAQAQFEAFIDDGLDGYKSNRNRPDRPNVSRLSPHLHWGEISPRQLWAKLSGVGDRHATLDSDIAKFKSEVAWREFSYHLLFHFPELVDRNWRSEFDAYPWRDSETDLEAWQKGQTGYPMVDAGMRELWQTGYMHNRVRMIVASFLIKHLRLHWRHGQAWFNDTLVDADLANNSASWQWVAGSGADAAPYFRIFNPMTQGEKFDPNGVYVRDWCPELKDLDNKYIHAPFEASDEILREAGITLGETYPKPLVDHMSARKAALKGYENVKQAKENQDD